MNEYCIENLLSIRELLIKINEKQYRHQSALLSGATIGQHIRHILDLYSCLLSGLSSRVISYDHRTRQREVELFPEKAISLINTTIEDFAKVNMDDRIVLKGIFSAESEDLIQSIETSIYREMAYNLEHSIHHQALIKVGLLELGVIDLVDENFGVAPATIRLSKKQQYNEVS